MPTSTTVLDRLRWDDGRTVISPPSPHPGAWAGAPCALPADGHIYLAYRLRRPIGQGRGYANVVARSRDGVSFRTVAAVGKDLFGAESLERPCLVVTDDGRWRLYVSCATPSTHHWRVDLLEAATPEGLAEATPRTVLPGDADLAVKDPVILQVNGTWHLWASCHPLTDVDHTDRMTTEYAVSEDGVSWQWQGTALRGRPGTWDARGGRISAVLPGATTLAFYDGRATAQENWEERTGVATGNGRFGFFEASGEEPALTSPHKPGGLRYLTVVDVPGGGRRYYYEGTRADGAHELRTQLVGDAATGG